METENNYSGPRIAAVRRTMFEMGITLNVDSLHCGSRILYYADADEKFAEYELDYIIFTKMNAPTFTYNPDEVRDVRYIS